MTKTEIDGFQVDWMYSPPMLMEEKQVRWMPCERQMYAELFGRPFPGKDKIDAGQTLEFQRRAVNAAGGGFTTRPRRPNPIASFG